MEYERLVNQHKDAVFRQMVRVCGNHADAEDVLIDALLRAWRNLDRLQDSGAFRAWLTQIARRVCWNLRSRQALAPVLQLSALPDGGEHFPGSGPSPEAQVEANRLRTALHRALGELPAEYGEVYRLRDIEERPGAEVARRLGLSLPAMKSRLHRARSLIRSRLESEFDIRHP